MSQSQHHKASHQSQHMSRHSQHMSHKMSLHSQHTYRSQQMSVVDVGKRVSQWEAIMRKFSQAHKEECKTVSVDIPRVQRSLKQFPTGSKYEGTWDVLGMSGFGTYIFPNDVVYVGEFSDGMFHGSGELRYPCGAILRGKWRRGLLVERTLVFADGLEYSETDWKYCRMPDRRFTIEYEKGIQPAGKSFLTADQPTRDIPPGMYDTVDGFYDPKTKVVYKADDLTAILRSPSVREQKWIIENCRTCPEKELGPRTDLYEEWQEPKLDPEKPPKPAGAARSVITSPGLRCRADSEVVRKPSISLSDLEDSCSSTSSSTQKVYPWQHSDGSGGDVSSLSNFEHVVYTSDTGKGRD